MGDWRKLSKWVHWKDWGGNWYIQLSILARIKADRLDGCNNDHHAKCDRYKQHNHMFCPVFQCQLLIFFFVLFHHLLDVVLWLPIGLRLRIVISPALTIIMATSFTVVILQYTKKKFPQQLSTIIFLYTKLKMILRGGNVEGNYLLSRKLPAART